MPTIEIPKYAIGNPTLFEIHVNKNDSTPAFIIHKRYTDFANLAKECEEELQEPLLVPLPPKPRLFQSVDLEARRQGLETMLNAMLRNPEFAKSFALMKFLDLYKPINTSNLTVDWISTCKQITNLIQSLKQIEGPKSRSIILQIKSLIGQLQKTVNATSSNEERNRRQQQLDQYLRSVYKLEQTHQLKPSVVRVLGKPEETSETINLDNNSLKSEQESIMKDQDLEIDDVLATIRRQKELGLAIHDEIVSQTEMLTELDNDVHEVNARLNSARKRTERINR